MDSREVKGGWCNECCYACSDCDPPESEVDDSVKYCPECETPNQFGDLCDACRRDLGREGLPT